jgi:hypothetical protein
LFTNNQGIADQTITISPKFGVWPLRRADHAAAHLQTPLPLPPLQFATVLPAAPAAGLNEPMFVSMRKSVSFGSSAHFSLEGKR